MTVLFLVKLKNTCSGATSFFVVHNKSIQRNLPTSHASFYSYPCEVLWKAITRLVKLQLTFTRLQDIIEIFIAITLHGPCAWIHIHKSLEANAAVH